MPERAEAAPESRSAGAADLGHARAVIRCEDVSRTFGSGAQAVVAVYGVTCTVGTRDRVAIVGQSGSGKSTLLHLFAGLETPSLGQVSWPALDGSVRDADRLGLVFQSPTLIPTLTVGQNVALPLLLNDHLAADAPDRARSALAMVELESLRDDLPQELSDGQAQRVVIARVLACRPQVILADEPTSRLDRATADHVTDVLLQVCDDIGAALVVATHDPAVGTRMKQVWTMADGRLSAPAFSFAAGAGPA